MKEEQKTAEFQPIWYNSFAKQSPKGRKSARIILITKIPPLVLNENLPKFLGCAEVEALFPMLFAECDGGKYYNYNVLEANKNSNFFLCNNGRVYTITKPYDQEGNMLTNMVT